MSLLGLAIIGRHNEPLYLCDCVRGLREARVQRVKSTTNASPALNASPLNAEEEEEKDEQRKEVVKVDSEQENTNVKDATTTRSDPFGFHDMAQMAELGNSLSTGHCMELHASLDRLEEMIESSGAGLPVVKGNSRQCVGCVVQKSHSYPSSESSTSIYAHITATNIKILVLARNPVLKEAGIRLFLNGIYDCFVAYMMNPFSSSVDKQGHGCIESKRFDQAIREAVRDYEDNRVSVQMEF